MGRVPVVELTSEPEKVGARQGKDGEWPQELLPEDAVGVAGFFLR